MWDFDTYCLNADDISGLRKIIYHLKLKTFNWCEVITFLFKVKVIFIFSYVVFINISLVKEIF